MSWPGVYTGVVVSTADPQGRGRVRLQVPQVSGTAVTGWVPPAQPGGAVPGVRDQVNVLYQAGDASYPAYLPPIPPPPDAVPAAAFNLLLDWTPLPLATGYTGNGNNNGNPFYRILTVFGSTLVECQGGINITYDGTNTIVNSGTFTATPVLPIPTTTLRTVTTACSSQNSAVNSLKIDFQSTGHARIVGTNTSTINPLWISLNRVTYYL